MGVIGTSELGTPERVKQLEKMKQRKTDHGETVVTCFQQLILQVLAVQNSCLFPLIL